MSAAGPFRPERGWARRWLVQSLLLALRVPAGAALVIAASWISGSLIGPIGQMPSMPGVLATSVGMGLTAAILCNMLMRADGYAGFSFKELLRRSAWPVGWIFLITSLATAVLIFVLPTGQAEIAFGEADLVNSGAVWAITGQMSMLSLNAFWMITAVVLGMGPLEAMISGRILAMRSPEVVIAATAIPGLMIAISVSIGGITGAVFFFLLITWAYVAAREIFGGIRHNGKLPVGAVRGAVSAT